MAPDAGSVSLHSDVSLMKKSGIEYFLAELIQTGSKILDSVILATCILFGKERTVLEFE
jgi:hypothetical protein